MAESRGDDGGIGLLGMRERIALVGGRLEVESSPGVGTTLAIEVPT
jgi:signal transduction histidine kinase